MASSSGNPWGENGSTFSHGLRHLISSETRNLASNDNFSSQLSEELMDRKEDTFISNLRAADSSAINGRENIYQQKLKTIRNEVKDVLSPSIMNDMETIFNDVTERFKSLSDRTVLDHITSDFNHKEGLLCLDVDIKNQQKLNQLISFADGLIAFESKVDAKDEKAVILSERKSDEIKHSKNNDSSRSNDTHNNADMENTDNDLLGSANQALDTCQEMIKNGELLEEQFQNLKDFHEEFKNHILKSV